MNPSIKELEEVIFLEKGDTASTIIQKPEYRKVMKKLRRLEARAIAFVKERKSDADRKWLKIETINGKALKEFVVVNEKIKIRSVSGRLFPRRMGVSYPLPTDSKFIKKDGSFDAKKYYLVCCGLTWDVSHRDVKKQIEKGVKGKEISAVNTDNPNAKRKSKQK